MGSLQITSLLLLLVFQDVVPTEVENWERMESLLPPKYYDTIINDAELHHNLAFYEMVRENLFSQLALFINTLEAREAYLKYYIICSCPSELVSDTIPRSYKVPISPRMTIEEIAAAFREGLELSQEMGHLIETIDKRCHKADGCRRRFSRSALDVTAGRYDNSMRDSFWQKIFSSAYPAHFKPIMPSEFNTEFQNAWNNFVNAFSSSSSSLNWTQPSSTFQNYNFQWPSFNMPNLQFPMFHLPDFKFPTVEVPYDGMEHSGTFDAGNGLLGHYQTYSFGGEGKPSGQVITTYFGGQTSGGEVAGGSSYSSFSTSGKPFFTWLSGGGSNVNAGSNSNANSNANAGTNTNEGMNINTNANSNANANENTAYMPVNVAQSNPNSLANANAQMAHLTSPSQNGQVVGPTFIVYQNHDIRGPNS